MTARTCGGRAPRALVLGAGISGLTSALTLVERGFQVTIVTERVVPDVALGRENRVSADAGGVGVGGRDGAGVPAGGGVSVGAGVPVGGGVRAGGGIDAYTFRAPEIDTEAYLRWLLDRVRRAGCVMVTRRVDGRLSERALELRAVYGADLVVNCAGRGASRPAEDEAVFAILDRRAPHNHGPGGAVSASSWGRAREVADLAAELA